MDFDQLIYELVVDMNLQDPGEHHILILVFVVEKGVHVTLSWRSEEGGNEERSWIFGSRPQTMSAALCAAIQGSPMQGQESADDEQIDLGNAVSLVVCSTSSELRMEFQREAHSYELTFEYDEREPCLTLHQCIDGSIRIQNMIPVRIGN